MSTTPSTTYRIRVRGHLDDHWSTWFGGADLDRCPDGTTSLTLADADQARLHGILGQLRDLGVELIELHAAEPLRASPAAWKPGCIPVVRDD
jgi:hypothetical protein